jgi:hypothetical protein
MVIYKSKNKQLTLYRYGDILKICTREKSAYLFCF